MTDDPTASVLIVGAGAAGLAAAKELSDKKVKITVLEARDRIGGRIFTKRPAGITYPVDVGAEFVHGDAPETFTFCPDAKDKIKHLTEDDPHRLSRRIQRGGYL
jgi:protoporphyrinogen oxidase